MQVGIFKQAIAFPDFAVPRPWRDTDFTGGQMSQPETSSGFSESETAEYWLLQVEFRFKPDKPKHPNRIQGKNSQQKNLEILNTPELGICEIFMIFLLPVSIAL